MSNLGNLKTIDKRQSALFRANDTIIRAYSYFGDKSKHDFSNLAKQAPTFLKIETHEQAKEPDWLISWVRFVDARKQEIFFIVLYTLWILFIFIDKAYCKILDFFYLKSFVEYQKHHLFQITHISTNHLVFGRLLA